MKKTLNLQLARTRHDLHNKSIGELLAEASAITNSPQTTLARHAIRAVCEEIIRTGHVWFPIEVRFLADLETAATANVSHINDDADDDDEHWLRVDDNDWPIKFGRN